MAMKASELQASVPDRTNFAELGTVKVCLHDTHKHHEAACQALKSMQGHPETVAGRRLQLTCFKVEKVVRVASPSTSYDLASRELGGFRTLTIQKPAFTPIVPAPDVGLEVLPVDLKNKTRLVLAIATASQAKQTNTSQCGTPI